MAQGDSCTLQNPLPIRYKSGRGDVEAVLERGVEVRVVYVSDNGRASVSSGDASGIVVDELRRIIGTMGVEQLAVRIVDALRDHLRPEPDEQTEQEASRVP